MSFGLALPFSSLRGMGIVQTKAFARIVHWIPISTIPLSFHGLAGDIGPLGSLFLSLGFLGPLTLFLPLILLVSLLAVILAMLIHWTCYLFPWASSANLLHLYLLFFPWASCHSGHVGPLGLLTCFYHSYFLFPSTSLIVGLLLSLGLSSKVGINTHINL